MFKFKHFKICMSMYTHKHAGSVHTMALKAGEWVYIGFSVSLLVSLEKISPIPRKKCF